MKRVIHKETLTKDVSPYKSMTYVHFSGLWKKLSTKKHSQNNAETLTKNSRRNAHTRTASATYGERLFAPSSLQVLLVASSGAASPVDNRPAHRLRLMDSRSLRSRFAGSPQARAACAARRGKRCAFPTALGSPPPCRNFPKTKPRAPNRQVLDSTAQKAMRTAGQQDGAQHAETLVLCGKSDSAQTVVRS